ncbi:ABC transporter ATP-binding protein [Kitasatospora phosalacinea]|uniref:ABC transporter ATP-binding protein n=1 Tax=Kitasatospora phosalacinea TaxID=2065 RepID=UPI0005276A24|nr:ABC transporter ATP-binding protein [Kitasatospora phosalacinea]
MTTAPEKTTAAKDRPVPGTPLLEVRDLHVEFKTRDGVAKAVNGVNYSVAAGETLAVLGESGSGKSVTAQTIMGILDMPPGRITSGEILFRGQDMLKMSGEERRRIRGRKIAMIFQDALSSLNPVLSVGYQLGEMFRVHEGASKKEAKILITHDLGVVADVADKIAVMYAGRIVETAPVHDLYARPAHPYTEGLLRSIPRLDQKGEELYAIKGLPPNLYKVPAGCAFNPRCDAATDLCRTESPALHQVTDRDGAELAGRASACHFWKETLRG